MQRELATPTRFHRKGGAQGKQTGASQGDARNRQGEGAQQGDEEDGGGALVHVMAADSTAAEDEPEEEQADASR